MQLPPVSPTKFQEMLNIDRPVKSMPLSNIPYMNMSVFIVILCVIYLLVNQPRNLIGVQGPAGPVGVLGVSGPSGPTGPSGSTGQSGTSVGPTGPVGHFGPPGGVLSGTADLSSSTWNSVGNLWATSITAAGITSNGNTVILGSWGPPFGPLHQFPLGAMLPAGSTDVVAVTLYIPGSGAEPYPTPSGKAGGLNWITKVL